jgi:hypothetical protein
MASLCGHFLWTNVVIIGVCKHGQLVWSFPLDQCSYNRGV